MAGGLRRNAVDVLHHVSARTWERRAIFREGEARREGVKSLVDRYWEA